MDIRGCSKELTRIQGTLDYSYLTRIYDSQRQTVLLLAQDEDEELSIVEVVMEEQISEESL